MSACTLLAQLECKGKQLVCPWHRLASNRQGNRATTQRTPTLDVGIPRTGGMLIPRHLIGSSATGLAVPLSVLGRADEVIE